MRRALESAGYQCVDSVYEHGEFAVRGSIMDLFPMGSSTPYRIELFDDEIESLRCFSPETQLSSDKVERISLLPGREYPLDANAVSVFNHLVTSTRKVRNCAVLTGYELGLSALLKKGADICGMLGPVQARTGTPTLATRL